MTAVSLTPDKDTYLSVRRSTQNYGTGTTLSLGNDLAGVTNKEFNVVMEWDLSASTYADVSTIVGADINLIHISDAGTVDHTVTVRRLGITFTEADPDGCNWTDNGLVNWNGGEDYAETNIPDVTFSVGTTSDDVTINVLPFVRDAIQRRSGILRLVFFIDGTPSGKGYTNFGSSRNATTELRPTLDMFIAERCVWTGAVNGSMLEDGNWEIDGVAGNTPTTQDFAIFNSGSVNANTGNLQCHTLMIGEGYTGTIGTDADNLMQISATAPTHPSPKRMFNQKRGNFFIHDITTSGYGAKVFISDSQAGSVYSSDENLPLAITGGNAEIVSVVESTIVASRESKSGTKVKLSGVAGNLVASHCKLILENGCKSGVFVDGSKVTCTDGTLEDATISGKSIVVYRGKLVDGTTTIYNGRLTFLKNENAEIVTEDILLFKGAVFDTRTDTGSWSPSVGTSIDVTGGGNFMVDAGKTVALGT